MAMATNGDQLIKQSMRELHEAHLEVLAANARVEAKLIEVEENLNRLRHGLLEQTVDVMSQDKSVPAQKVDSMGQTMSVQGEGLTGLTRVLHSIKTTHEGFFEKVGRTLNMLIEQQAQDRLVLEDHERRLTVLEQA